MTSWLKNYKEFDTEQNPRLSGGDFVSHGQIRYDIQMDALLGFIPLDLEPSIGTPESLGLGTPSLEILSLETPSLGILGTSESLGTLGTPSLGALGILGTPSIGTQSTGTPTSGTTDRPGTAPYLTGGVQLIRFQRYRIRPSTR